jgi:hypothetical protein
MFHSIFNLPPSSVKTLLGPFTIDIFEGDQAVCICLKVHIDYFIESATYGFLFTRCKTLENERVLQRVNKIRTKHFLCCYLFIIYITRIKHIL